MTHSERSDDSERESHRSDDDSERESHRSDDDHFGDDAAGWFAESTLRVSLALVGFVLLLFALGQVAGLDLLGMVVDALNSDVGRWLIVAFFALLIIAIAVRGFGSWSD